MKRQVTLKSVLSSISRTFSRRKTPGSPEEFKALFDRFKNVLDRNNQVLETITDMGEKLGGDYLFDISYLNKTYAHMKQDMQSSLSTFDELTQGRYQRLHKVFAYIDSLITRMLDDAPPAPSSFVVRFDDIPWGALHDVGGKNAHLAEVKNQLHLNVPDAFAITTAAFDSFISHNNLAGYIERAKRSTGSLDMELQELRELIVRGAIPPDVRRSLKKVVDRMKSRHGESFVALRSSANEEDSDHSFAGQFKTMLYVPLAIEPVELAYRHVIASLYSEKAISYQRQMGYDLDRLKMAVGCLVMVDAVSSGVIYTTAPDGDSDTLIITATWGLGESVVEGKTDADFYVLRKGLKPELLQAAHGKKDSMIVGSQQGGTQELKTPDDLRGKPCLSLEQLSALAQQAIAIERYFGSARDIEWAIDKSGTVFILQARPLKVLTRNQALDQTGAVQYLSRDTYPTLLHNQGTVVQRGAGAGQVFIAEKPASDIAIQKGAVLVARHDSSLFVSIMPYVSAIITETGSTTSHMAALCRELKIPTIVNVPNATKILKPGQDITLLAEEDNGSTIYSGIIRDVLAEGGRDMRQMEDIYEFRRRRYVLRYISPLHLIDPLLDDFTPERCRSMHDILRFMHEKAVAELVENARIGGSRLRQRHTITQLDLPVPAGILVMDMGGGLQHSEQEGNATFDQITSIPFKAIVKGLIHPGAWHSETVALKAQDFLSSMMRMPDITNATDSTAGYNVAIVSREYVNMSIRFGYHFNMIDCYCSEKSRNNHIYFRFAGGATDITKRSRRLELLAKILREYGFTMKIKGDLLIARIAGLSREDMEKILDQTGRLVAYARQLDALLHDETDVDRYAKRFLEESYEV